MVAKKRALMFPVPCCAIANYWQHQVRIGTLWHFHYEFYVTHAPYKLCSIDGYVLQRGIICDRRNPTRLELRSRNSFWSKWKINLLSASNLHFFLSSRSMNKGSVYVNYNWKKESKMTDSCHGVHPVNRLSLPFVCMILANSRKTLHESIKIFVLCRACVACC